MSQDVHKVRPFEHPARGRKRAKATPKGRQVDPIAAHEVEAAARRPAAASRPADRAPAPHPGQVPPDLGRASCRARRRDEAVVRRGVRDRDLLRAFRRGEGGRAGHPAAHHPRLRLSDLRHAGRRRSCSQNCRTRPVPASAWCVRPASGAATPRRTAEVGHNFVDHATVGNVLAAAAKAGDTHAHLPAYVGYDAYVADGGYKLLDRLRAASSPRKTCSRSLDDASLRGLGGAGFPTGRKWRAVLGEPGPRLMAVNGDEGEPGTFKDRYYLETDPHRFLEGMLIGAHIVEAAEVYIYIRDEYPAAREILEREIAKLPPGGPTLHLRRGAGAYICGEESSLLESIEGKRGLPRHKPPYPFQVGLFGLPTLINNIETLWWVRDIVEKGADWWKSHGRHERHGPAQLLGVGPREESRHEARAGRHHRARTDRRISAAAWPTATPSTPICRAAHRAASCRPRWTTSRSISARWRNTAASSARAAVVILSQAGQRAGRGAEPDEASSRTRAAASARRAASAPQKAAMLMEQPVWNKRPARSIEPGDARCFDLRPRPGRLESADLGDQIFSRRVRPKEAAE